MRRIFFQSLAVSSVLLAAVAGAATRPHYGGTLRVAMRAAPTSLDPADPALSGSATLRNISRLVFDTLAVLDDRGQPQPGLATSWRADLGNQRWQFFLRRGVNLHDGSPLTSDIVAASLRLANPGWKIFPAGDSVSIELDPPVADLPVQLALPRNGITRRNNNIVGTGPYAVSQWDPGKKLVLTARDDYWGGRGFLDSVEVEMGRSLRDQRIALELGHSDVIEVAPEQSRRAAAEGRRVQSSSPVELVALFFSQEARSAAEVKAREALSLSIDRTQMSRVLLQGGGETAASILPNWMTGYAFLFSADTDLAQAKQLLAEAKPSSPWTLSYDSSDPLGRLVAERVVLNARDAGISVQPTTSGSSDVRLVRIPLASPVASVALGEVAATLRLSWPKTPISNAEALYATENGFVQSRRLIPLLHLRSANGIGAPVQDWTAEKDGSWNLPEVWLLPAKP